MVPVDREQTEGPHIFHGVLPVCPWGWDRPGKHDGDKRCDPPLPQLCRSPSRPSSFLETTTSPVPHCCLYAGAWSFKVISKITSRITMSNLEVPDPDLVQPVAAPSVAQIRKSFHSTRKSADEAHVDELEKPGHVNYSKVDKELAQYANDTNIEISEEENNRLRRMIDKRVLVIMVTVYLLQALDKGTMTFASIMGIKTDANLVGQEYSWLTTCIYITILIVEYPQVKTPPAFEPQQTY